jgi:LCP family protein required for cell wall assembly
MSEQLLRDRSSRSRTANGIARHGRLRRSKPIVVLLKFLAAALAVVLVSGASVAAITGWRLSTKLQEHAVVLVGETEGPPPKIGAIEGGFNILIVGTDTREGQGGLGGTTDDADGELNDVNILLHVSQDQTNAVAVSFPRDLVVGIPECVDEDGDTKGYSTEPINVSLYYGGLPCAVQTVSALTGLPIQFAGMISFVGVVNMSQAIGGVPVCVNGPVVDDDTGINLPQAGTYELSGLDALAFLRSRSGVGDGSDLTRISSQQVYLSALVRKLKSDETLGDIGKVYGLANAAAHSLTLSTSLANIDTMVSIALALKNIPLERVTFVQYPGTTGGDGVYAGKVRPDTDAAEAMFALIAADQPFQLAQAGDGRGSEADPNAPVAPAPVEPAPSASATAEPTAAPVDNSGLPLVEGVSGQTAAQYTCSVSNY